MKCLSSMVNCCSSTVNDVQLTLLLRKNI